MKLYIDSANLREIREIAALGLVEGVTTTPASLAAVGSNLEEHIREICSIVDGPVAVSTVSQGWEELVEEGRTLANIHRNVVVKIPLTEQGLRAIRRLAADGIRSNATLCFSPVQAMLAAKCSAAFVSLFVGNLDGAGADGLNLVEKTLQIYNNFNFPTQIVVSEVKTVLHVREAALVGADSCTIPFGVFKQLTQHPQTKMGMQQYLDDWKRVPKN